MGGHVRAVGLALSVVLVLMSSCGGANDSDQSSTNLSETMPEATQSEAASDNPVDTEGGAESGAGSDTGAAADTDTDTDTDTGTDADDDTGTGTGTGTDADDDTGTDTDTRTGTADEPVSEADSSETEEPTPRDDRPPPDPAVAKLVPVGPGDSGDDVVALQEHLAEIGFGPGAPDGSYGNKTTAAVAAFQELSGLAPSGELDRQTLVALADYRYDGLVLRAGDEGPDVEDLQERLAAGPFDPGPIDGDYGGATVQAVWALEKLAGVPLDGDWGPLDEQAWAELQAGAIGRPEKSNDQRWVEVDLSQQLAKVYDPGQKTPTLIVHISSGSGVPWANEEHSGSSITPLGDFHIDRRIAGWRESSLNIGRLYNPLYFNGGIAFHGANSVPLYPASHGCVRVPLHIAEYLPDQLPNGTPVHVLA